MTIFEHTSKMSLIQFIQKGKTRIKVKIKFKWVLTILRIAIF